MKFTKDPKRRKIEKRLWEMLKEISIIKSKGRCELCKGSGEQRDHCFSASKCTKLRFDHRNITNLCGKCHSYKSYEIGGYEKKVDHIVLCREGWEAWQDMEKLALPDALFKWTLTMLEEKETEIKNKLEEIKHGND